MESIKLHTAPAGKMMCLLGALLGVLFSASLFAQANFGRILGTVTDQTGAVLPGATVSVIDTQRGLARTLTTDQAGEYNAPTLTPGTYNIRVEVKGFKMLEEHNIVLEVGKEVRVDLTPQPGDQAQTVTVTEAIQLVDTTSATLGGTVSNADINDLPLNGRNYQSLLALRPGVMVQAGGGPWTQSTNNVRPDETGWMLDGVINVNFYDARPVANQPSPLTDAATIVPIDAIQEFNIEENPKAEFGWKPGAVVNVGIRSGTNTLHGSAYAFGRDVDWDARNLFNSPPAAKVPVELEQYGGVVGGRIKKDKLFFFAGYEALRSNVGNNLGTAVPETAAQSTPDPKNSLVDAITALQAAGVTPSPVSLKLAGCTLAPITCTGGFYQGAKPNTTTYNSTFPNTNISDNGIGKMDYRVNGKNMINGMLWTGDYKGNGMDHPITAQAFTNSITIRTWTTVGNWIWTPSSRLVNEARFGLNRAWLDFTLLDNNILADGKGYPINTGVTAPGGLPIITVSGFAQLCGWRNRPNSWLSQDYHYLDNVSYLMGKHNLKVGGEFTHIRVLQDLNGAGRGQIDFKGGKTLKSLVPSHWKTS
jgi:Carboxypeptidase regulatory-like domain